MSSVTVGVIGLILMVVLFLVGVPVAVAMTVVGFAGAVYLTTMTAGLSMLVSDFYTNFSAYSFSPMPMFILMGSICFYSGISSKLFDSANSLLGGVKGGLAMATVGASALFGALTGSANAAAAAMGKVALPEMQRYKYNDLVSTPSIAAGGCLGILIPPSGVAIIYGTLTQQSISKLFIAGLIPGIVLTLIFCINIWATCKLHPDYAPASPKTTLYQKLHDLLGIIDMLLLFLLVIGGMFFGWFTATQSGAIGAAGAFVLGVIKRNLSWEDIKASLVDTVEMSCMVMALVAGAAVFGHFMTISRIPSALSAFISGLPLPNFVVMLLIILLYFVGGCFMDSMAMVLITVPILYPIVIQMGYDPLWFCVIIIITCGMGLLTPPVGLNVYIVANMVPDVPMTRIFRGCMPFLISMWVLTFIMMFVPQLATWLPGLM